MTVPGDVLRTSVQVCGSPPPPWPSADRGDHQCPCRKCVPFISTVLILVYVLTSALAALREVDVVVSVVDIVVDGERSGARVDALVDVDVDVGDRPVRFAVEVRQRAPYPNELPGLDPRRCALERIGWPMFVAPFVPVPVGSALTDAGWSWVDDHGNFDVRGPGLRLSQRRTTSAPRPARRLLPSGSGSWAIIRSVVASGEADEPGATALAQQAGVTQARASQVLGALARLELVHRTDSGRWRPDRPALLERFLREYPGPGGAERYWYSLDELEVPGDVLDGLALDKQILAFGTFRMMCSGVCRRRFRLCPPSPSWWGSDSHSRWMSSSCSTTPLSRVLNACRHSSCTTSCSNLPRCPSQTTSSSHPSASSTRVRTWSTVGYAGSVAGTVGAVAWAVDDRSITSQRTAWRSAAGSTAW